LKTVLGGDLKNHNIVAIFPQLKRLQFRNFPQVAPDELKSLLDEFYAEQRMKKEAAAAATVAPSQEVVVEDESDGHSQDSVMTCLGLSPQSVRPKSEVNLFYHNVMYSAAAHAGSSHFRCPFCQSPFRSKSFFDTFAL
jgi:hypothetical protein